MSEKYHKIASWFYDLRNKIQNKVINIDNFSEHVEPILHTLLSCDLRDLVIQEKEKFIR